MAVVEKETVGRALVVKLSGELDLVTSDSVKEAIDPVLEGSSRITDLVIDLTQVRFIDSSGLGMLLGRYKKVSDRGGKVIVFGLQPAVERVLAMAGITKIVEVAASRDAALAHY